MAFTETWFNNQSAFNIDNYQMFSKSRSFKPGGGVAIYIRCDINAFDVIESPYESKIFTSKDCEQIWCQSAIGDSRILFGCIYRPPPSSKSFNAFVDPAIKRSIEKASKLIADRKFTHAIILGDFNYPLIQWSSDGASLLKNDTQRIH